MQGKVEICGVNTAKLPVLRGEETRRLLEKAQSGQADHARGKEDTGLIIFMFVVAKMIMADALSMKA